MNDNKTAMMKLIDWMLEEKRNSVYTRRIDYINKAKSLLGEEQDNIKEGYTHGSVDMHSEFRDMQPLYYDGDDYYNDKYGNDNLITYQKTLRQ